MTLRIETKKPCKGITGQRMPWYRIVNDSGPVALWSFHRSDCVDPGQCNCPPRLEPLEEVAEPV
jgi:hypothetical protein